MIKATAIVILSVICGNINGVNYNVSPGTYLTASPNTAKACVSISTFNFSLSSSYFTSVGKPITYFTSQQFAGNDSTAISQLFTTYGTASSITANGYSNIQSGASFYYSGTNTPFVISYSADVINEPVIVTRTVAMETYSTKDSIRLNLPVSIYVNNFTATASTANTTIGSTSCLTINFSNPCRYIIPETAYEIKLPVTPDPSNPSVNITPLSAFNTTTCNVTLNGTSTSSKACSISGDLLTVSGLSSSYVSAASISLVVCDIKRANPAVGSPKLTLINTVYTNPSNRYGQASFTY